MTNPPPSTIVGDPARLRRARFESLALPHLDALYGLALRLCHNARDAEDLVQDAVLRSYQSFDRFTGDERCKAWLFRVLTNIFINKYRRRVLERRVAESLEQAGDGGILSADVLRRGRDPEAALQAGLVGDSVQRALLELPEDFRMAVLLCDVEEFSYREIAEIMDCPVGTVMSRLHRGRRLLQEALRGLREEPAEAAAAKVIPLPRRGRG